MFLVYFGFCCRIGEATLPGPATEVHWSISVCNSSGTMGKGAQLSSLDTDLIAMSETHLTSKGRQILQATMSAQGNYSHLVSGFPVASRYDNSEAGQWSGVALASRHPSRALCVPWPDDMFETGRVQVASSFVANTWVTGGIIYGYPASKMHHSPVERTNALVTHVVEFLLLHAQGPRYVCGDWNATQAELPISSVLLQQGWQEIQTIDQLCHGSAIQPTCKRVSQKDFLWVSTELAACFDRAKVLHDEFPDHAVLQAHFTFSQERLMRFVWPTPSPVHWDQVVFSADERRCCSTDDPTEFYHQFWQAQEQAAQASLGQQWFKHMGGRGSRTKPLPVSGWQPPPRKGRTHDVQPTFHGYDLQHGQWMKQLRRLDNYRHWAHHHFGHSDSAQLTHGLLLWQSIIQAAGFPGGFCTWWSQRMYIGLGDPGLVPLYMPPPAQAAQFFEVFQCEVRWLETQLKNSKRSYRSLQHELNPNLVYRDVRRPMPAPVTSLLHIASTVVTDVVPEDSAIVVDPPQQFDPSLPLLIQGKPVDIIHDTPDKLFVTSVDQVQVAAKVEQPRLLGSLPDIFEAFHEQWRQRWCRHDSLPVSHWNEIVSFARDVIRWEPVSHLHVDPELLHAEVLTRRKLLLLA